LNFGIVTNTEKESALVYADKISNLLTDSACRVVFSVAFSDVSEVQEEDIRRCDFVYVLGGDGTIMTVARMFALYETGIIGVNLGHLGYLSEIDIDGVEESIRMLKSGKYSFDKRMMLEGSVQDSGVSATALNDFVVSHVNVSRILDVEIAVNNEIIDHYLCDGIIVSTPTGSTAYSLSAGGPVVSPDASCIIVSPICPHMLRAKSIVLNDADEISVQVLDGCDGSAFSGDGQIICNLNSKKCRIKKSPYQATFIRFNKVNFFNLLRNKLNDAG